MSGRAFTGLLFMLAVIALANTRFTTVRAEAATSLEIGGPDRVVPNSTFDLIVTAFDGSGHTDTSFSDTVRLTSTGSATLPPDYTFTPADGGVHAFTLTITSLGAQSIGAQDVTNPAVNSDTTVVTVGAELAPARAPAAAPLAIDEAIVLRPPPAHSPAISLSISGSPRVQLVTPFTVTVIATDANGLPLADFRDTVHLTSSGNALLPRDYEFTTDDAGLKGFTLVFLLPGAHILGVQDVTNPEAASGTFVITADASVAAGNSLPLTAPAAPTGPVPRPTLSNSTVAKGTPVQSPPGAPAGTSQTSTATCPTGKTLLSGGGTVTTSDAPTNAQRVTVSQSFPSSNTAASAVWTVVGVVGTALSPNEQMNVTAYALCQG